MCVHDAADATQVSHGGTEAQRFGLVVGSRRVSAEKGLGGLIPPLLSIPFFSLASPLLLFVST
jgi:hypothetical protein